MINEQLDIYFVEGNKMNGYKWEYATRIGVILPPNPNMGNNHPTILRNFDPKKGGIEILCRKGEKPNQQSQGGGYQQNQNNYQNQGGGYQNQGGAPQQNTPAPKSENDYGQFDGNYQRPR